MSKQQFYFYGFGVDVYLVHLSIPQRM